MLQRNAFDVLHQPSSAVRRGLPANVRRRARGILLIGAAALATLPLTGGAATLTWDSTGASPTDPSDGAGTWDTATPDWSDGASDGAWNNANSDTSVFGNSNGAGGTVTLGTAITAGSISFNAPGSGNYVIGNTSANALTINSGGVAVASGVNGIITSPIAGSNGLTVSGGGTLQIGGSVTPVQYTGNTTINNATLQFNNLSPSKAVTLGNGTSNVNFQGTDATLVSKISQSVQLFVDANINVADGTTASILFSPRTYIGEGSSGGLTSVSGGETSTLNLTASTTISRDLFYSSATTFDGTLNIQPSAIAGSPIVFEGVNGSFTSSATGFFAGIGGTFNVNGEISTANPTVGDTYTLGALAGASTGVIDTPTAGGTATWSVGSLSLSTTFAGAINGNNALTVTGGTLALTGHNAYTGVTTVTAGELIVGATGALPAGTVSITDGELQLAPSTGLATIASLAITGNGTLDVNNNHLVINYGANPDPVASIAALLKTGYANGAWNGAGGIVSSAAAANASAYGLGYADAADPGNPAGLANGTLEIAYTLLGDADLNAIVNGIDFGIVAANFNQGVTAWDQGDFDYNGIVNGVDFGDLAANFNKGASGASAGVSAADWAALDAFAAANGLLANVPEPASLAFIALPAAALFILRPRKDVQS